MIKVFEIILCMYLKTIFPDVPDVGGTNICMFYLLLTNIKKNIGQAILVGKCCHCRINTVYPVYPAMTAFTDQYSLPNNLFYIGQL
jgi:hypothetical protein